MYPWWPLLRLISWYPIFKSITATHLRGRFNIKMPSYQYMKSHCGDKTVVRSSYLHNGISYTGKTASLYWIRGQESEDFTWRCLVFKMSFRDSTTIQGTRIVVPAMATRQHTPLTITFFMNPNTCIRLKVQQCRQNCRDFADIFKCICLNETVWILLRLHWSLFLRFELTICQHWFR